VPEVPPPRAPRAWGSVAPGAPVPRAAIDATATATAAARTAWR